MNIRALTYFLQVADAKSYSAAAKKLYVAQSSLSTTIKKLESELSIKLFNYDGKNLNLTTEGVRLYDLAREFLNAYDAFSASAEKISEDVFGTLNIILPPLISDIYFADPIAAFYKQYPNIKINIANRGGYAAQNLISVNEYDLAVVIRPVIPNIFNCINIATHPMVLVAHESHPLASRTSVTYEELASETFLSYEEDSVLYQRFISKTTDAGYAPQIIIKSAETTFLLSLVEQNVGIFVVPTCVIDYRKYKNIKIIPIESEEQGYELVLIYKKNKYLSTASQTFIDFIKDWYNHAEKE